MRQTEKYSLNQWDPTDRILREDFNADNVKIAEALAGLETRKFFRQDPLSTSIPYSLSMLMMHTKHIQWGRFSAVHYILNIVVDADNPTVLLVAGHPASSCKELASMEGNLDPENRMKQGHLFFFPMYDKTRPAEALVMGMGDTRYINFGVSFGQIPDLFICTKLVGNTRPRGLLKDSSSDIYTLS